MKMLYTRIHSVSPGYKVRDQDGAISHFGSNLAFDLFKRGISDSNWINDTDISLFDEIEDKWLIGKPVEAAA